MNDCCFLGAAGQTAGAFADGTVLAALIAGRGQHPWGDACCPPLGGTAGLTAQPVLRWQQQTLTADTSDAALLCGKTQAVRPVGGAFGTLTYTSSNPAVASIENGVITAHKAGTVTITAEASATGGYYASTAGYRLTVSHDYTEKRDAGYHWQTCVCGDVTAKTAHHWVNGAVRTAATPAATRTGRSGTRRRPPAPGTATPAIPTARHAAIRCRAVRCSRRRAIPAARPPAPARRCAACAGRPTAGRTPPTTA